MIVHFEIAVTETRLADLLTGAFEGGSNYWITRVDNVKLPKDHKALILERLKGEYYPSHTLAPVLGGTVTVYDEDHAEGVALNAAALHDGLAVMAENYPRHFADVLAENDDATTADVFLQCALFGEVLFS